ncbi:DUF2577 domain-containing protein [Brevibacillus fluminis]|uniref:DUF2577 domain-containing protein n=1 Tax=Brevibacillus fluminis TaxID=511487 RepID=A0A3M8DUY8_9BACL|nr:DUF2577 family protein [Brevibacillus fluminis]RNB91993.1 DUF2577 domain-containing protein [Brevibacillus fluminis]
MYNALQQIFKGAREGMVDTQVEFGRLLSVAPLRVKLDEDPAVLEEEELVYAKNSMFTVQDIGSCLALLRCTNGQYLIVMEVTG